MMSELQTLLALLKTFFTYSTESLNNFCRGQVDLSRVILATEGFASVTDLPALRWVLASVIKLPAFGGEGKGRRLAVLSADWLLSGPFVYDDDACQTLVFSICANAGFFRLRV